MIENGSWRVRVGRTVSSFAIMMLIVLGMVSRSTLLAADERKHKGSDDGDHSAWDGRDHQDSDDRDHQDSDDRDHEKSGHKKVVLASDWSHEHLVFSGPKTVTDAFSLSRETRYVQQWVRRNAEQRERGIARHQEELLSGDWSMFLGNTGKVGADRYPAKYSFDVTTANCGTAPKPDFVVYNTSLVPSASAVSASRAGTFTATPTSGDTVQITDSTGTTTITLTADNNLNTLTNWQVSATLSVDATNLRDAIIRNGAAVGVTASASGNSVTVTSTNVGTADNGIALFSSHVAAFAWAGVTLTGGRNGASIVAFDNLYAVGCTGTVPSVYWAYNTGGTIINSVALSGDGSQVAFVQTNAGTALAELVLLKWKASTTDTVNSPTTPTDVTGTVNPYRTCTAPCMIRLPFSPGTTDSNSSPFYDFAIGSDKLYVGNDNGQLLQFTGVFAGTPAQSGGPTWPVNLNSPATATTTTSPVFDQGTGKAYIADTSGFLYSVNVTTGAVIKSGQLAAPILGISAAPVVDSSSGFVYIFASDNNAVNCSGAGAVSAVYQISVNFAATNKGTSVTIGTCGDIVPVYDGDFDNAYYTSASGNAGNLYVCGNPGGNPTLYQIGITAAGAMGAVNTGPNLGTTNFPCSPVTEVNNPNATGGAKDWIFMSVQTSAVTAAPISCPAAAGCIMSFNVTSGAAITPATATAARASAPGGASGVVLDNTVSAGTLAGASQVYFSTLANGTCATSTGTGGCSVQASQSALF